MKVSATSMRRFQEHKPAGNPMVLGDDHPAVADGHSLFQARVTWAGGADRVLKSGHHSRKIGKVVTKGEWAGYPIFTLTLEERATCPRTCKEWAGCYGNKMNWSERFLPGEALEDKIEAELAQLERDHPRGFVVRLHVLGDFYSVAYVNRWLEWLDRFTGLHVFGYSAWGADSEIGALVHEAAKRHWQRFAVRQSGSGSNRGAVTIAVTQDPPLAAIVCPAQRDKADCCGTCTLCWSTQKPIAFLRH